MNEPMGMQAPSLNMYILYCNDEQDDDYKLGILQVKISTAHGSTQTLCRLCIYAYHVILTSRVFHLGPMQTTYTTDLMQLPTVNCIHSTHLAFQVHTCSMLQQCLCYICVSISSGIHQCGTSILYCNIYVALSPNVFVKLPQLF